MNPLYVGIDVSSKNNVAYLMLPNGDKHSNFPIINSHDGSVQLVQSFYHLKYKEVTTHQHKRALALTARKFVRLVFTLLKDNRLYRPAD